jgi:hypothetical protein
MIKEIPSLVFCARKIEISLFYCFTILASLGLMPDLVLMLRNEPIPGPNFCLWNIPDCFAGWC